MLFFRSTGSLLCKREDVKSRGFMVRFRGKLTGLWVVTLALCAALVGCSRSKKAAGPNGIDPLMEAHFAEVGHELVEASEAELCRRLSADLLGHFPSVEEVASECVGRSVDE